MGKIAVPHSDLCGCERCARQWDTDNPRQVYDMVEDPDTLDCGCSAISGCSCWDVPYDDYDAYDDLGEEPSK